MNLRSIRKTTLGENWWGDAMPCCLDIRTVEGDVAWDGGMTFELWPIR